MMFDTDMFLFSLENLTVSNLNVNFSLTYLFVSSRIASEKSAIVSQLSKIFCRFTSTPFLIGSAKVRAFLFLPNFSSFFWKKNQKLLDWKSTCFVKNLTAFLEADGKGRGLFITSKFYCWFFFKTFILFSFTTFRELPVFSSGLQR